MPANQDCLRLFWQQRMCLSGDVIKVNSSCRWGVPPNQWSRWDSTELAIGLFSNPTPLLVVIESISIKYRLKCWSLFWYHCCMWAVVLWPCFRQHANQLRNPSAFSLLRWSWLPFWSASLPDYLWIACLSRKTNELISAEDKSISEAHLYVCCKVIIAWSCSQAWMIYVFDSVRIVWHQASRRSWVFSDSLSSSIGSPQNIPSIMLFESSKI